MVFGESDRHEHEGTGWAEPNSGGAMATAPNQRMARDGDIRILMSEQILDTVQNSGQDGIMRDEVEELLRRHGVQVTTQRLAIIRAVSTRPHVTADLLVEDVRAAIGSISRQAVYDSLGVLVEKNLIRRIQPAGSAARYENRVGDNHHHLICRTCGTTCDIDCAVGATPCLTADDDHGFEIDEAEVIYWGRCPRCRTTTSATTT